jgi:hypothetical protein
MCVYCLNAFTLFHTVEVTGSIPVPPTMKNKGTAVYAASLFILSMQITGKFFKNYLLPDCPVNL